MAAKIEVVPFTFSPDDPYAAEHAAIVAWVEDASSNLSRRGYASELNLKNLPTGEAILAASPDEARRFVLAALQQIIYWDQSTNEILAKAGNGQSDDYMPLMGLSRATAWRRQLAAAVLQSLLRRNLPFNKSDLVTIIDWCTSVEPLSNYHAPLGQIARTLERYAAKHEIDVELNAVFRLFASRLRAAPDRSVGRLATTVEQLCTDAPTAVVAAPEIQHQPPAEAALAGTPHVLVALKQSLGMLPQQPIDSRLLEPDDFPLPAESPLETEHELFGEALQEFVTSRGRDFRKIKSVRQLVERSPSEMGRMVLAGAERYVNTLLGQSPDINNHLQWQAHYSISQLSLLLLDFEFELDRQGTVDLLLFLSVLPNYQRGLLEKLVQSLIESLKGDANSPALSEGERFVLSLVRNSLVSGPALGSTAEDATRLSQLINDGAQFILAPGEFWSDCVNEDFALLSAKQRSQWLDLLRHALTAATTRPSAKWLKTADKLIAQLGDEQISQALGRWFALVAKGQSVRKFARFSGDSRGGADTIHPENADCLRGLLWCVPLLASRDELLRPVTAVALSAFKKVPGIGPRAPKVGNACVYVLSQLGTKEAVGQLAMLKVRVKSGSAQKEIEKAFEAAAAALGLKREEIEELGVPSYGLEEVGRLVEPLGNYRAEILVTGVDAELNWSDAAGKPLKSVPAKVKSEHKEELKDLQQSLKDIKAMLPAQRDRIDGMFLLQKSWPIAQWRERYHDHPLVGTIARRLIWCVDGTPTLFESGIATDVHGAPIPHGQTAEITLWHPIGRSIEEVTAWRNRLETLAITQPFKQAYREVYLLTDAERNTRVYSNRFAAHIIRQHQFNALCAARGWKNKLRLMVDDTYPPASKSLPNWGLRAEFWIDGIGQDYGVDTNDSGTYLRLATDQVRFYRMAAADNHTQVGGAHYTSEARDAGVDNINEPIPLDEVPPLVFSEIMRDVDLFVGVGSVGNDPTWQDGGPEGRYRDYWHTYSFGELSGTATTRKQVLERLIPRLKIASRCTLSDRFLVVRGDRRTYKIHLGSGNILMEPNDQYLCIVPDARARATQDGLYLPFDGDAMLSVIISKALLLAADTKIKDSTIVQQIEQG